MNLIDHAEKLPLFIAVYESRNIRKASLLLNMTQPPLSYAIKQLEESLGVLLFHRSKRGVEPTESGSRLYEFAKKSLYEMKQLEKEIKTPKDPMAGVLTVGTYDSIARYFWPRIFLSSSRKFPNLNLQLSSHRTSENIDRLLAREIDYSILVEPHLTQVPKKLQLNSLYVDHYSIYQSARSLKHKDNFIYVGGAYVNQNQNLDGFLAPHIGGFQEFKLDSFEVCREFIKKGLGIGVLPSKVAQEDLASGLIEKVSLAGLGKKKFGKHSIYECFLGDSRQIERIQKFSRLVRVSLKG